jgi:hypothetical protein
MPLEQEARENWEPQPQNRESLAPARIRNTNSPVSTFIIIIIAWVGPYRPSCTATKFIDCVYRIIQA